MQLLKLNTRTKKSMLAGGALLGAVALAAPASYAQTLTEFAAYGNNANTPRPAYVFTNTGSNTSSFTTNGSPISINFQYEVNNGYGTSFSTISALLTLSGTANGAATVSNGGNTLTQNLSGLTFSIIANGGQYNGLNLLSGNFTQNPANGTDVYLTGAVGGGAASLNVSASNAAGVSGFSSNFLNFSNQTSQNFTLALSAVNNTAPATGNGLTQNANGYLNSFTASGTAIFSSNPPPTSAEVPEPGTLALVSSVALMGAATFRRRLRRIAK